MWKTAEKHSTSGEPLFVVTSTPSSKKAGKQVPVRDLETVNPQHNQQT